MGIFDKLFGGKDPLTQIRRAIQQKRWADALVAGESVTSEQLPAESRAEFDGLLDLAGDALAALNLEEARACQRIGDAARAAEHFQLAAQQARSAAMRQQVQSAGMIPDQVAVPNQSSPSTAHDCRSSCSSGCAPGAAAAPDFPDATDLDPHTRWELLLATYPPELAERYAGGSPRFQQAVLAAHAGDGYAALALFAQIPSAEQNDLFHLERGAVLAQSGENAAARRDFSLAVELNPRLLVALEALISLELEHGWEVEAEKRLQQCLAAGQAPQFCHERLALLSYRRQNVQSAARHGEQALALGSRDPQTLVLTAHLLEQGGNLSGAESVLQRLEGGGCGGGGPVALAEFWLRHRRNLDKALESFKAAARQEGDNPRWALRIGQVYLAKGWKKEGVPLLRAALKDPRLDQQLQQEGEAELLRVQGE